MVSTANLGYPSIGKFRELKKSLESYWKGNVTREEFAKQYEALRAEHFRIQADSGLDVVPCGEFSLYDRVLDLAFLLDAVPDRYRNIGEAGSHDRYFAMARGRQSGGEDVVAMEMTKWFDTNYHYIVPELRSGQEFKLIQSHACPLTAFEQAATITGKDKARPVLVGPITFLKLSKFREDEESARYQDAEKLARCYVQILENLRAAGVTQVQIDEPALVTDLPQEAKDAYAAAYAILATAGVDIHVTSYFGPLGDNTETALALPVASLHIDAVRGAEEVETILAKFPADKKLSLGLIDGRNIWKTDLEAALALAKSAVTALGTDRVILAPSCSLLHVPADLDSETKLPDELKRCFSFAKQKLEELHILKTALNEGEASVKAALDANKADIEARRTSSTIHNAGVKARVASLTPEDAKRSLPHQERKKAQQEALNLPLLPTTTIGSFPQTAEIRAKRRSLKEGAVSAQEYDEFLKQKTQEAMRFQDEIDVDVPVHGEYERNDMVEYFGERLQGFCFTEYGWVQSYGSRCVKPPIIYGDISRPEPMTVKWTSYAQTCTKRPVKGMLTGPVTILQWSFVRDDQPRETTCRQIALAIRDEVTDLEKAGIYIIQIDEPAFREGLPLRAKDQPQYLQWAVECFRISSSSVESKTQIHTHMCYSEFNDIIDSIADMDADVISIETSRSAMDLLEAFYKFDYPNDIGPGVYDIHSPRVPQTGEMQVLLQKALEVLKPEQVWVNPDCGLKTRAWPETEAALKNMVQAAKAVRADLANQTAERKPA